MENQILTNRIQTEVDALVKFVENISEADFFQQPNPEKWSIAQNIQHLFQSSKPLVGLFGKPELMEQYGRSNRHSRNYEGVETLYKTALQSPPPFLLAYRHLNTEGSKEEMLNNYKALTVKFLERVTQLGDADLDSYQIPHPLPLVGLLTAREFVHFTGYHTQHHHEIIKKIALSFS